MFEEAELVNSQLVTNKVKERLGPDRTNFVDFPMLRKVAILGTEVEEFRECICESVFEYLGTNVVAARSFAWIKTFVCLLRHYCEVTQLVCQRRER